MAIARSRRGERRRILVGVACVTLATAGCGGGSGGDAESAQADTAAAAIPGRVDTAAVAGQPDTGMVAIDVTDTALLARRDTTPKGEPGTVGGPGGGGGCPTPYRTPRPPQALRGKSPGDAGVNWNVMIGYARQLCWSRVTYDTVQIGPARRPVFIQAEANAHELTSEDFREGRFVALVVVEDDDPWQAIGHKRRDKVYWWVQGNVPTSQAPHDWKKLQARSFFISSFGPANPNSSDPAGWAKRTDGIFHESHGQKNTEARGEFKPIPHAGNRTHAGPWITCLYGCCAPDIEAARTTAAQGR